MIKFKDILNEQKLTEDDLWDMYHDMIQTVLQEYTSGKYKTQPWPLAKFSEVKRVWSDFVKFGFIRNEQLLEKIAMSFINSYLKLSVNTYLLGHTTGNPREDFENYDLSEDDVEKFADWTDVIDKNGYITYRLSDYALEDLHKYVLKIINAKTPEEKIVACDGLLNVIHMRSDLSSWFVEGGKRSLDDLAGYEKND